MKISIEVEVLTHQPAGMYRYTSNLLKKLADQYSELQLEPFVFADNWPIPHDPELFYGIFKKRKINKYHITKAGNTVESIIETPNSLFNERYQKLKKIVAHKKNSQKNICHYHFLKLQRELFRNIIKAESIVRYRNHKNICFNPNTDVVHSMYFPFPTEVLTEKRRHILCQTVHDIIPILYDDFCADPGTGSFQTIIESARLVDLVLVPSESTKRDLFSLGGFDENKIVVTPLAVGAEFFPASLDEINSVHSKIGIKKSDPYFLSVSTLEPRKNFPFLLKNFRKLIFQLENRSCKLVITGRVGWGDSVNREIQELIEELQDHVIYTGFITDEELRALYTGAAAFLMPSHYEGFGLPILEAMACGTPVIASNTSSMPEVVGDAGTLLSPTDGDGWINAMKSILTADPQSVKKASRKAIERSKQFSWQKTAKLTVDAYRRAIEWSR